MWAGSFLGKGDVTITMDDDNLLQLMTGQLNPQQVRIYYFISKRHTLC